MGTVNLPKLEAGPNLEARAPKRTSCRKHIAGQSEGGCARRFWNLLLQLFERADANGQEFVLLHARVGLGTQSSINSTYALASLTCSLAPATFLRCQIPWPFFNRELCRKAHIAGANLKGASEDFRRTKGNSQKIGR